MAAFYTFCGAVLSHLVAWITGSVVTVLVLLYERMLGKLKNWPFAMVFLAVGFFVACYLAWLDEYRPAPQFIGGISGLISITDMRGMRGYVSPYHYAIVADMWIENDGSPSVTHEWDADALNADRQKVPGRVIDAPNGIIRVPSVDENGQHKVTTISEGTSLIRIASATIHQFDRKNGVVVVGFKEAVDPMTLGIGFDDRTGHYWPFVVSQETPEPTP